ncbi:MAG: hypothetical protein NWT12_08735 [Paracoccaceae bacterium]|jgi:hypothetical protein|nr:hypothetical protein [Paracoccaceae bacterium]
MFITQIDIAGLHIEHHDNDMRAHVAVMSDMGRILVDCRVPMNDMEPETRRSAVLHEAIRQLRRMPEFRSGKREIRVADGLLA